MANFCYNCKPNYVYVNDDYQWATGTNGTEIGSVCANGAEATAVVTTWVDVYLAAW